MSDSITITDWGQDIFYKDENKIVWPPIQMGIFFSAGGLDADLIRLTSEHADAVSAASQVADGDQKRLLAEVAVMLRQLMAMYSFDSV